MNKIIVVGGGPAGMMAAIRAAEKGAQVTLFEKNFRLGRKLSITGKGRCNLTNAAEIPELISNIPGNGKFLNSALRAFNSRDTINFFENLGLATKLERGNRIFPASDKATDVVEVLKNRLEELGVTVRLNARVEEIISIDNKIYGVIAARKFHPSEVVILATGGLSYPMTGSTGDGLKFAKDLGHTITEITPALVPLEVEEDFVKDLQGLTLKNVRVTLLTDEEFVDEIFGEMLFTHFGVSGPIILTLSRQVSKLLRENEFVELLVNLKPALTLEQLNLRILRDFEKFKGKIIKNALGDLLPQKLISVVLDLAYIDENKKVDVITRTERQNLLETLRGMPLTITKTRPVSEAIVTSGGISVKEVNPKTMESKIIENLYLAGEILDVDGNTGGFNLQAAWATGNAAGIFSAQK